MNEEPQNWELVYTADQEYKIVIITDLLAEAEIVSHFINKKDHYYNFGNIELYVRPDDVLKAKLIIEKAKL
ncbi:MAG: hypothetical protein JXR34_04590 [Bacteroidales bacterium]|nr:hypothetical protein [Bacteroidales bacterium]